MPRRTAQRWKRWEREVATKLRTVRQLHRDGRAGADVEIPTHSIQVKTVQKLPSLMMTNWLQAKRDTLPGKSPALVYVLAPGPGIKARRFVVLDFDDWVQALDDAGVLPAEDTQEPAGATLEATPVYKVVSVKLPDLAPSP